MKPSIMSFFVVISLFVAVGVAYAQVTGSGTPGTVPVWTGDGTMLTDSLIQSGPVVSINAPLQVSGTSTLDGGGGNIAVAGSNGVGLSASGTTNGVVGTSSGSGPGVLGNGGTGVGVSGTSTSSFGVQGIGVAGVVGQSNQPTGSGVRGVSNSGFGVEGHTGNGVAVAGLIDLDNPNGAIAVGGSCTSTLGSCSGVVGYVTAPVGQGVVGGFTGQNGTAVHGTATSTTGPANGVVGETASSSGIGVVGLSSSADGGNGVNGGSNSQNGVGVLGFNTGGGLAGRFDGNVQINGNLNVSGTKSSLAKLENGRVVALYAVESPENWFEDFGTAELRNGEVKIPLEATFAETVNAGMEYHVFLTPNGDCRGLYIAAKTPTAFEVRELQGGNSNIAFDYRIVARRRGFEGFRLKEVPANGNLGFR